MLLKANLKEIRGRARQLRKQGLLPAIVYGRGFNSEPLSLDYVAFAKTYKSAGESTLIDLQIAEREAIKVLIQDIQHDPITGNFIHVDFHRVRMDEEVKAEVELNFIGESTAVKSLGGILVKNKDKLEIECLPADLLHSIDIDISKLENFHDVIRVGDLQISDRVKIIAASDEVVVTVIEPRSEAELKALEEKVEEKDIVAQVEGVKKEEKEEETTINEEKEK